MSEILTIVATDNVTLRMDVPADPKWLLEVAEILNAEMEARKEDAYRAMNDFITLGACQMRL